MASLSINAEQQLRIVKLLARGVPVATVVQETGLPAKAIEAVSAKHGGPDRGRLGWAADHLQSELDVQRKKEREAAGEVEEVPAAPAKPTPTPAPTSLDHLIRQAEQSTKRSTRTKAARLAVARDELLRLATEVRAAVLAESVEVS